MGDAKAVAALLQERFGVKTRLLPTGERADVDLVLLDATRNAILSRLNQLRKSLQPADSLLIYYAGHGWAEKEIEEAFWIPTDAVKDDFGTYINARDITVQIKLIKARHVLVVADSCYTGALSREAPPDLRMSENREQYLNNVGTRKSRLLLSSGASEPVWDGGGGGHSVFTHAFLEALSKLASTSFTAHEASLFIKEAVAGTSPQSPQYMQIRDSGHEWGDFIF